MNKVQKLEYQQQLDAYMEKHQIYDLLQGLMKSLLQEKPKDPIDYLISHLEKPQPKLIFIVGPPGSEKAKIAQELANELNCSLVSTKSIFEKQITKKTPEGLKIEAAKAISAPIDDETVINLIVKKLKKHEAKGKNSIVSGFPINVVQALALQTRGIMPTKLLILKAPFDYSYDKALKILPPTNPDRQALAKRLVTGFYM